MWVKMVYFNIYKAKKETIKFLRYPIPRTPIEISRHLKENLENFYPKTKDYRTIKSLKENVLNELIDRKLVVRYTEKDENWKIARKLINRHRENKGKPKPRKLTELYQINFFYIGKDTEIHKLPVIKEVNLELVALLYRFIEKEKNQPLFWNLLNLFYCYSKDEYKGKIRVKIHGRNFNENESKSLDRLLDHTEDLSKILDKIPFKPDIKKATTFLKKLN